MANASSTSSLHRVLRNLAILNWIVHAWAKGDNTRLNWLLLAIVRIRHDRDPFVIKLMRVTVAAWLEARIIMDRRELIGPWKLIVILEPRPRSLLLSLLGVA